MRLLEGLARVEAFRIFLGAAVFPASSCDLASSSFPAKDSSSDPEAELRLASLVFTSFLVEITCHKRASKLERESSPSQQRNPALPRRSAFAKYGVLASSLRYRARILGSEIVVETARSPIPQVMRSVTDKSMTLSSAASSSARTSSLMQDVTSFIVFNSGEKTSNPQTPSIVKGNSFTAERLPAPTRMALIVTLSCWWSRDESTLGPI
mmetsp:Transcript_17130/g.39820  ORF Transcript_17130/g.39820 Transcript_17130/m.39820 type:complete len:209 (+) Transcript_17130:457-1083(+)